MGGGRRVYILLYHPYHPLICILHKFFQFLFLSFLNLIFILGRHRFPLDFVHSVSCPAELVPGMVYLLLKFERSLFRHLLLCGEGFFLGVVSSMAQNVALTKLAENSSNCCAEVCEESISVGK